MSSRIVLRSGCELVGTICWERWGAFVFRSAIYKPPRVSATREGHKKKGRKKKLLQTTPITKCVPQRNGPPIPYANGFMAFVILFPIAEV